jgi:hypothetical protein
MIMTTHPPSPLQGFRSYQRIYICPFCRVYSCPNRWVHSYNNGANVHLLYIICFLSSLPLLSQPLRQFLASTVLATSLLITIALHCRCRLERFGGTQKEDECGPFIFQFNGWDLAKWLERLAVNGSILIFSDTVESEGRKMKQCWITYIKK